MQCPEFQKTMRQFIDGDIDRKTRKQVALHLAQCEDCARLIEQDKFWDESVLDLLDREAPADLRTEILGDLAGGNPSSTNLGWKKQMKIIGWAATRNNTPRQWWKNIVIVAGIIVFLRIIAALTN